MHWIHDYRSFRFWQTIQMLILCISYFITTVIRNLWLNSRILSWYRWFQFHSYYNDFLLNVFLLNCFKKFGNNFWTKRNFISQFEVASNAFGNMRFELLHEHWRKSKSWSSSTSHLFFFLTKSYCSQKPFAQILRPA